MTWKRHKQYRLPGYDYASAGTYFITIVCKDRQPFFGEIQNGVLCLSQIGVQLESLIEGLSGKIDWCAIQESQVMPNHLHLIVLIHDHADNKEWTTISGLAPLRKKSLSSFANHLKGKLTRWCHENGYDSFKWQGKFHDRIIRDEQEYLAISRYIQQNVDNWKYDNELLPPFNDHAGTR